MVLVMMQLLFNTLLKSERRKGDLKKNLLGALHTLYLDMTQTLHPPISIFLPVFFNVAR